MKIDSSQKMVGITCIEPVYENKLNELNVRYQKLKSKSGLGLGTFIGKTLLERKKAIIELSKSTKGGALVEISWENSDIIATY